MGQIKQRESNIELCRLLTIFGILLIHSIYGSLGWPETIADTSVGLILGESFGIIGVNVFILITGYFSVMPKRRTFLNIVYVCLFYAVFRIFLGLCLENVELKYLLFITKSNWFIPVYLALIAISVPLNLIAESVNKTKQGG